MVLQRSVEFVLLSNKFGRLTVACLGDYGEPAAQLCTAYLSTQPLYLFLTYLGRTRANLTRPGT